MKELSSDTLYYKSFVGLIVTPVLIAAFISFVWKNDFPDIVVNVSYVLLAILTFIQWIRWSHCRKVFYDGNCLILKRYFSDRSESVPIFDIINVKFVYNYSVKKERTLIKLSFKSKRNSSDVYFFRNCDRKSLDKLLNQITMLKDNR